MTSRSSPPVRKTKTRSYPGSVRMSRPTRKSPQVSSINTSPTMDFPGLSIPMECTNYEEEAQFCWSRYTSGYGTHYASTQSVNPANLYTREMPDCPTSFSSDNVLSHDPYHVFSYHVNPGFTPPMYQADLDKDEITLEIGQVMIPDYMQISDIGQDGIMTPPLEPLYIDQDLPAGVEYLGEAKPHFYSMTSSQPRAIRSASEREKNNYSPDTISMESSSPPDGPQLRRNNPRSDPLYDAKPAKDGFFYCPFSRAENCNHAPTKQKCIYAKNLDSHLKPYVCKFGISDEVCRPLRFSSNACLFRHEREMHGMHNHGVNPYHCEYSQCERSRKGNGFPRRWNQRDHMKRVHGWDGPDKEDVATGFNDTSRRRKGSSGTQSVAMRRTGSTRFHGPYLQGAKSAITPGQYSVQDQRGLPIYATVDPALVADHYYHQQPELIYSYGHASYAY